MNCHHSNTIDDLFLSCGNGKPLLTTSCACLCGCERTHIFAVHRGQEYTEKSRDLAVQRDSRVPRTSLRVCFREHLLYETPNGRRDSSHERPCRKRSQCCNLHFTVCTGSINNRFFLPRTYVAVATVAVGKRSVACSRWQNDGGEPRPLRPYFTNYRNNQAKGGSGMRCHVVSRLSTVERVTRDACYDRRTIALFGRTVSD